MICRLLKILSDETESLVSHLKSYKVVLWQSIWTGKLLNLIKGWLGLIVFLEKTTSWSCLIGSGFTCWTINVMNS